MSLAELRDAVRLSSPVRHPDAKGGKPAQSQHVNRSPGVAPAEPRNFRREHNSKARQINAEAV
ncbi:hypothetical protein ABBQ38_008515 [Trebouxia sp. C0009 RCD-2024]